jgi:hypothetical protein
MDGWLGASKYGLLTTTLMLILLVGGSFIFFSDVHRLVIGGAYLEDHAAHDV